MPKATMPQTTITCDQAIFTSIRTLMGEGYRIIAASSGLTTEEKQIITRCSPSHGALCSFPLEHFSLLRSEPRALARVVIQSPNQSRDREGAVNSRPQTDGWHCPTPQGSEVGRARPATACCSEKHHTKAESTIAVAGYPLPPNRYCVARSWYAGAEHTGRGGQRTYTYNLVFHAGELACCGFNPLNIVRAMETNDLTEVRLKPPTTLPKIEIEACADPWIENTSGLNEILPQPLRRHLLQGFFTEHNFVLNTPANWVDYLEALLMGLPGPMRTQFSFSAGINFSVGRSHRLHLLYDPTTSTKTRSTGQRLEYLEPGQMEVPLPSHTNTWTSFVDRHWENRQWATLALRTSKPFANTSLDERERIARLYDWIDDTPNKSTQELIQLANQQLEHFLPKQNPKRSNRVKQSLERSDRVNQSRDCQGAVAVDYEPRALARADLQAVSSLHKPVLLENLNNKPEDMALGEIVSELLSKVQAELVNRFQKESWDTLASAWPAIVNLLRRSDAGADFASPIVQQGLRTAARCNLDTAFKALVDLCEQTGPWVQSGQSSQLKSSIDAHLNDLANRLEYGLKHSGSEHRCLGHASMGHDSEIYLHSIRPMVERLQRHLLHHPVLTRIEDHCTGGI